MFPDRYSFSANQEDSAVLSSPGGGGQRPEGEFEVFELDPFNKNGGLGKMWQLFGDKTDDIINELNEALAA